MKTKTIIQAIIIISCFGAAGLVLFNGFKKSSPSTPVQLGEGLGTAEVQKSLLPYGKELDFDGVFKKYKFIYGRQDYPKLNYSQDVGIDEQELIKPLSR